MSNVKVEMAVTTTPTRTVPPTIIMGGAELGTTLVNETNWSGVHSVAMS